jgi:hypothetical protein
LEAVSQAITARRTELAALEKLEDVLRQAQNIHQDLKLEETKKDKARQVQIPLDEPSSIKHTLIPVSKETRPFFPGYKVHFTLETDIGDIETYVTSAPKGILIGSVHAGGYIRAGLKPWYHRHSSLSEKSILIIEMIERKRYRLSVV